VVASYAMKAETVAVALRITLVVTVILALPILIFLSCKGCPPPPQPGVDSSLPTDAGAISTALVLNNTTTPTTVYVSFGGNNAVDAASWPFCGDSGAGTGCAFPLSPGASQALPSNGQPLNATIAFDQFPSCGTTLAEFNLSVPGWSQDTANISLVNGWSNNVSISVSDASTLGPTQGPDANADVYGVFPVACDICVARASPPCGFDAGGCTTSGSCGCKSGTQYNPSVPCQESFARGSVVTVALVSH
jgi:hypothetical protein